ncbi:protein of unknown function [Methylocaldum szegediense]|uniref:Transposase n=1 Tax=Methylocaldum szegediense TaxID=73780 RepID=A0ABM9I657_9GAMM|nr:protein of unknown function [Methylocaldum szegediense]
MSYLAHRSISLRQVLVMLQIVKKAKPRALPLRPVGGQGDSKRALPVLAHNKVS